jgi:hypothetical protein
MTSLGNARHLFTPNRNQCKSSFFLILLILN